MDTVRLNLLSLKEDIASQSQEYCDDEDDTDHHYILLANPMRVTQ